MNFDIKEIFAGKEARIYTIHYSDEEKSEFRNFFDDPIIKKHKDFDKLTSRLMEIADKYGCQERFLKEESENYLNEPIRRINYGMGYLRLYCIRWDNDLLILGGGGIKPRETNRWQETPELAAKVRKIEKAYLDIEKYLEEEDLTIEDLLE